MRSWSRAEWRNWHGVSGTGRFFCATTWSWCRGGRPVPITRTVNRILHEARTEAEILADGWTLGLIDTYEGTTRVWQGMLHRAAWPNCVRSYAEQRGSTSGGQPARSSTDALGRAPGSGSASSGNGAGVLAHGQDHGGMAHCGRRAALHDGDGRSHRPERWRR